MNSEKDKNTANEIIKEKSENLVLLGIKFENGYFISISKKDSHKIGTTAITLPFDRNQNPTGDSSPQLKINRQRRALTTATVLGTRNELFAKALAEKLVYATNKIVYLSVFFDENDEELFKESLSLIEKITKNN